MTVVERARANRLYAGAGLILPTLPDVLLHKAVPLRVVDKRFLVRELRHRHPPFAAFPVVSLAGQWAVTYLGPAIPRGA
jgi:hypothetical protein